MDDRKAVRYEKEIPDVIQSIVDVHQVLDGHGLERSIIHLVQLRASQINRCGFCVSMHTREARDNGETSGRLDRVVVWDQVRDFTDREQAALAWTEALTVIEPRIHLGDLRAQLRQHFSDREIAVLTATIAMINLWNRVNISRH